jgi:predicted transcriptional regulator YheO
LNKETLLKNTEAIASCLNKFFGDAIEVVVHDFSDPNHSIRAIYGNLTGRRIGDPVPERLRRRITDDRDMHNYPAETKDGRPLKASTVFLRDGLGVVIGALSINYDLTEALLIQNSLERFSRRVSTEESEGVVPIGEVGIGTQVEQVFRETTDLIGRPVPLMNRSQKIQLVHDLERRGIFLIKGAVDEVARLLGVSRYTVYNYRKKVSTV